MRGRKTIYAADLFCGGGGFTSGLMRAAEKRDVGVEMLAINHWETAVETHAANHPSANHLCASLSEVDPSKVVPRGRLDLLLASPECTHHSIARGGKPMSDQSRASAWHVLHWAERLRVERIALENVAEFSSWSPLDTKGRPMKSKKGETFQGFLAALRGLGYTLEWKILNAADYGGATTRRRLFLLATRGHRAPRWPVQTHARKPGLFAGDLAPWRAAREVIDWSIPGASIFDRERPLAENTLRRIEEGLRRFGGPAAEPFLVLLRGTQRGHLTSSARDLSAPVPTLTAGGTHVGLCQPFLLKTSHRGGNGAYVRPVDDPVYTITTAPGGEVGVVEPFLASVAHGDNPPGSGRGNGGRVRSIDDPAPTVTGTGRDWGIVEPFLVGFYGEREGQAPRSHDVDEPVPTIPATGGGKFGLVEPFTIDVRGADRPKAPRRVEDPLGTVTTKNGKALVEPFVVEYYGTGGARPVDAPMGTVTTRDRFGLVEPGQGRRIDIRFRMLQPHELSAAMGFPAGYQFKGNRGEVVRQIGNAVEVRTAEAVCGAALDGRG